MNKSNISSKATNKFDFFLKSLFFCAPTIVAPLFVLSVCIQSYAIPSSAEVAYLNRNGVKIRPGGYTIRAHNAQEGEKLRQYNDYLEVPGGGGHWVHLKFQAIQYMVQVGPAQDYSAYTFPCRVSGNLTLGFTKRNDNNPQDCHTVKIGSGNLRRLSYFPFHQQLSSLQASRKILIAQGFSDSERYYCGAVPTSEMGQGKFSVGLSQEDACQKATEKCQTGFSGQCSVANLGDWNIQEPALTVSMLCRNRRSHDPSDRHTVDSVESPGSTVEAQLLSLENRYSGNSIANCEPIVSRRDEVIVVPVEDDTLIQTKDKNGSIVVDVLAGATTLISADFPIGKYVEKGFRYRQGENKPQPIEDCNKIRESEETKDFFDSDNWLDEGGSFNENTSRQLDSFRSKFCQSSKLSGSANPANTGGGIIIKFRPTDRRYGKPSRNDSNSL
jgi:hypothetical protein